MPANDDPGNHDMFPNGPPQRATRLSALLLFAGILVITNIVVASVVSAAPAAKPNVVTEVTAAQCATWAEAFPSPSPAAQLHAASTSIWHRRAQLAALLFHPERSHARHSLRVVASRVAREEPSQPAGSGPEGLGAGGESARAGRASGQFGRMDADDRQASRLSWTRRS